ncbi:MAG: toll/interleukin-1 receptor domain-containing protein [Anaerolineales bacterium]|nr:toll/interleukin-1 receptor domain-containing protein [Anaerolineales bacterium]
MSTIWITYAWEDNKSQDVDFIAQELISAGLKVNLDRWNLRAGVRLWDQIANFITSPNECDGWLFIATQNSLGSEACQEEMAYAIDRALSQRTATFPLIGLFLSSVDKELIPAAIKARLFVSIRDPDWKERIKSSVENRQPNISRPILKPYHFTLHPKSPTHTHWIIEVGPRAGSWVPFFVALPVDLQNRTSILHSPKGRIPLHGGSLFDYGENLSADGKWWIQWAGNEATPTMSYFISTLQMPEQMAFGVFNGKPQYLIVPSNEK